MADHPNDDNLIPTKPENHAPHLDSVHSPLAESTVAPFAEWMDESLRQFEERFRHLMRPARGNKFGR